MKLKDWVSFNRDVYDGDLIVKVPKQGSYNREDLLFHTVASFDACEKLFGEYDLVRVGMQDMPNSDIKRLGCLLWANI